MSIAFSDTTNKDGIIQQIEQTLGFPDGHISGDTTRLKQWTGSINLGLDKAFHIIFNADGRWQFDDRNHTDYPELTANLVASQRDYPFTTDSNSNFILAVHKVAILPSATATVYREIDSVDAIGEGENSFVENDTSVTGVPDKYDKSANGIFLDPIPSYSATNGLKIIISREGSYFTTSDTTKYPGFAGLYHEYLVLEPAYRYARANNLEIKETLKRDVLEMEQRITEYYSRRDKDERDVMTPEYQTYE